MDENELSITRFDSTRSDEAYELGHLMDAIDLASDQDRATWLTDDGKRIAAIVPVDVLEAHEASIAAVLAGGGTQTPLSRRRQAIQLALVDLGLRDLTAQVGVDPATLADWEQLVRLAEAGKAARSGNQ